MASVGDGRRVLIIVQNLPVPFDRRVWLEATTLAKAGYEVSVICPKSKGLNASHEQIEGVDIYRYALPFDPTTKLGFFLEFGWCWLRTFMKSLRVAVAGRGFDVIHACNPPETYWALGRLWRPFGKKFLFDHHDLSPEMYRAKFGRENGLLHRALLTLEKSTFNTADVAIATNESHREVAIERGGMRPDKVFVVRSGPDLDRFKRYDRDPAFRRGKDHLITFLGNIGNQDNVDGLMRILKSLRDEIGRSDFHCVVVGGGAHLPVVQQYAEELGVSDLVTFTGVVTDDELCRILSSADVGVDPVKRNPWSDRCTMNKVVEYMYFGLPVVGFDLTEAKVSAGPAGVFVADDNESLFARELSDLFDDEERRAEMGKAGMKRIEDELAWVHSRSPLLQAYEAVFGI